MSTIEITLSVLLGLVVNEFTDVSPWLARKLVGWSAQLRYGDTARADIRAEELAAVINDRPGKLFKLTTGIGFISAALLGRLVSREPEPLGDSLSEASGRRFVLEEEPTGLVAQYLFPTEKYRGEWRRHWISIVRSMLVIAIYAVLGCWLVIERVKPQYVSRILIGIVVGAVLLAGYRLLGWYFGRFVITNKRLMSTEGVLFRRVAMLPLLRVTDFRYMQSPIGRALNYGTFLLESASRRNGIRKLVDLPNPNELYLRLVEEMYEPEAVEARLGYYRDSGNDDEQPELFGLELAEDAEGWVPPRRPAPRDPVAVQREIIHRVGELSGQLAALSDAIRRLTPEPVPAAGAEGAGEPFPVPPARPRPGLPGAVPEGSVER